jgi:hypothetical protein
MSIIVCPSGLTGEVRHLKGAELRLLSNQQEVSDGTAFDKILDACWVETKDQGPYGFDGRPRWSAVLTCDRFYALLQIRIATHGPTYEFQVSCQSRQCRGKKFWWDLPLDSLPVKPLPPESVAVFRAGNAFAMPIGDDGAEVVFRLNVGADEKAAIAMLQREVDFISVLATRIVKVRMRGGAELTRARDVTAFLEELPAPELTRMFDRFEEVDGGIDTALEVYCPRCREHAEVNLPFDSGFFLPRSRSRRSGAAR